LFGSGGLSRKFRRFFGDCCGPTLAPLKVVVAEEVGGVVGFTIIWYNILLKIIVTDPPNKTRIPTEVITKEITWKVDRINRRAIVSTRMKLELYIAIPT